MVKYSLRKMLDKYPYFMNKEVGSNLYKVTKVFNSVFHDLYESLFHTYQGFHLNKRLLTWRVQHQPYVYKTNFACDYPNIKVVEVYKDDVLIYRKEFGDEELEPVIKKDDIYDFRSNVALMESINDIYSGAELIGRNQIKLLATEYDVDFAELLSFLKDTNEYEIVNFYWTYDCSYVKTNMLPVKVYRCTSCDGIYFGDELPYNCIECGSNIYITTNMYQCDVCGEIYFANPESDGSLNINCKNNCGGSFTRVYAYRCMGNHSYSESVEEVEGMGSNDDLVDDCGEIYIGTEPPDYCSICGASGIGELKDLYYNDETLMVIDNSMEFTTPTEIVMSGDITINPIEDGLIVNSNKYLFVNVVDSQDNPLKDVNVSLFKEGVHEGELKVTDENGYVTYNIGINNTYKSITFDKDGYVSQNGDPVPLYNINLGLINNNYLITVKLWNERVYTKLNTYEEESDYDLRVINNVDDIYSESEVLRRPFPVIPDDRFIFNVETWEEYSKTKGYPENDEMLNDVYDHDYSLDDIGKLNNIPRKRYIDVNDNQLYPLTEPAYNKYLTEDDYHYMKRMIEYNLRMWISLYFYEKSDVNYDNYLKLLKKVNISEEEYDLFKLNANLFAQQYNPVTLELWKNYSVPSTLINREKYLLKLFDLRRHNSNYVPYKVDENGLPLKKYYEWELDEDKNPINDSVGRVIYKDKWEVVNDLSECWIPEQWEHKDKFCDYGQLYDPYFFVSADTLRPLPYETVYCDFKLLNKFGDVLNEDYHVVLEYYRGDVSTIKKVNNKIITTPYCYISYRLLNSTHPTTVRFNAYLTDYEATNPYRVDEDNFINSIDLTFNSRNSCNADIYVDVNSTETTEDGSSKYPYKDLQVALNHINANKDLICLKSDLTISKPYFVPQNARILGLRQRSGDTDCSMEKGVQNVPVITNTVDRRFFNLIGGKNCELKLVDLRLKNGALNSYIGLGNWLNKNQGLDNYETVIIHGGLVKLMVSIDKNEYYPTDIVKITIKLTDKKGNIVANQKVALSFDGGTPIVLEDTDGDGVIQYNLYINKLERGVYNLVTTLQSDIYFNSSVTTPINCTKEPQYIISDGHTVHIVSTGHKPNEPIKVYIDGAYVETIYADENGVIEYDYLPDWGTHVIIFVDEEDNVVDMIIVETKVNISSLIGQTFIKNFDINTDGDITYDTVTIKQGSTLKDLDGVLINLELNNVYVNVETFEVKDERDEDVEILASDGLILKEAIIKLEYNSNEDIKYTKIGEFWRE